MTELQLKRLNELDYLIRHGKKDRDLLMQNMHSNNINLNIMIEDGLNRVFDNDLIQEMLQRQLMRLVAKLGEWEKEFDAA